MARDPPRKTSPLIRFVLYLFLGFVGTINTVLFILARSQYNPKYVTQASVNDRPFWDPILIELLVCSILGAAFAWHILRQLWYQDSQSKTAKNWVELLGLFVIGIPWTFGALAIIVVYPSMVWVQSSTSRPIVYVFIVGVWLGHLTLVFLFLPSLFKVWKRRSWNEHFYDTWGHRRFDTEMHGLDGRREGVTNTSGLNANV